MPEKHGYSYKILDSGTLVIEGIEIKRDEIKEIFDTFDGESETIIKTRKDSNNYHFREVNIQNNNEEMKITTKDNKTGNENAVLEITIKELYDIYYGDENNTQQSSEW